MIRGGLTSFGGLVTFMGLLFSGFLVATSFLFLFGGRGVITFGRLQYNVVLFVGSHVMT